MGKRVFLIVLDSFGIGEMPDADKYGDVGSNTLRAISKSKQFHVPNLERLGLFNIDGVDCGKKSAAPAASFARLAESSNGKDTTIGHWEIGGIISEKAFPTYPQGFPQEILDKLSVATGRGILCNRPYSGTQLLLDYGREHVETGDLIVYTSADSVLQIAAHEEIIPVEELYRFCEIARNIMEGPHAVGRIIARPFVGGYPDYKRTANRHDFSLEPPRDTVLDILKAQGFDVISVGKIYDIFAGKGLTSSNRTKSNWDGMEKTIQLAGTDFEGLCFVNLVDFDMLYGHRNDVDGYAAAATEFDGQLAELIEKLGPDDLVMITADHGCDPETPSTDHSREYVPLLAFGQEVKEGVNLGTRPTFADIAATVQEYLGVKIATQGTSFWKDIAQR